MAVQTEKDNRAKQAGAGARQDTRRRKRHKKYKLNLGALLPEKKAKSAQAAGEGAPPPAQRRRRRRKRGRLTLNYLLFGTLGAVVLCILCYFVFFKVYKIETSGDLGVYQPAEIIAASGVKEGESLFKINEEKISAAVVAQLPYVRSVQVHKKFPTTVELAVTPSLPVGAIETAEGYLYINEEGKILDSAMAEYDKQYPLITGITPNSTTKGAFVLSEDSEQINMLSTLLEQMQKNELEKISRIDINRLNMRIVYDKRVLVELGTEADLDYKIKFVKNTLEQNLDSTVRGVLDVTMENWGVFQETDIDQLLAQEGGAAYTGDGAATGEGGGEGTPSKGSGITVDPKTGAIIVGPHDPLNPNAGASSKEEGEEGDGEDGDGEDASSSSGGASSKPSAQKGGASSQEEKASSSEGGTPDFSKGSSSGASAKGGEGASSGKESSSKASSKDSKKYLTV